MSACPALAAARHADGALLHALVHGLRAAHHGGPVRRDLAGRAGRERAGAVAAVDRLLRRDADRAARPRPSRRGGDPGGGAELAGPARAARGAWRGEGAVCRAVSGKRVSDRGGGLSLRAGFAAGAAAGDSPALARAGGRGGGDRVLHGPFLRRCRPAREQLCHAGRRTGAVPRQPDGRQCHRHRLRRRRGRERRDSRALPACPGHAEGRPPHPHAF